jgi:hypothetical protein
MKTAERIRAKLLGARYLPGEAETKDLVFLGRIYASPIIIADADVYAVRNGTLISVIGIEGTWHHNADEILRGSFNIDLIKLIREHLENCRARPGETPGG